jgi:diguanylate cyclase (GGDEF)-like protein
MSDETLSSSSFGKWLDILQAIVRGEPLPEDLPIEDADTTELRRLIEDYHAVRQFAERLSAGDLSAELKVKGALAGYLKTLQAHLRHLTWQVQRVAEGDLTQRVEFMGEFSIAFNKMIESLRQARQAEEERRLLAEVMRDTAAALNAALDLEDVFRVVLDGVVRLIPCDAANVMQVDRKQTVRVITHWGFDRMAPGTEEFLRTARWPLRKMNTLKAMTQSHQPYMLDDVRHSNWLYTPFSLWTRSYLGAPIVVKDEVIGFINLLSTAPHFFTEDHAGRLMTLAHQTAVAVERAYLFERLQELATMDSLTGLSNRRHFFEMAEQAFERARRYRGLLSALMLDVDHFKKVNDLYGHSVGDQVLQEVGRLCRQNMRRVDIIGRYGGEEIAFVMPETGIEEARVAAERLRQMIEKYSFETQAGALSVTVSIGVAGLREEDSALHFLLDRADQALYQAKQGGRNRVAVYER